MTIAGGYDVCVIGAGIAGALIAYELAKHGRKVVLLEAGSRFDPGKRTEQLRRNEILGERLWPWEVHDRDHFIDTSADHLGYSYQLNDLRVKAVGGSTLHWGALAQRLRESDFRTYTTYGSGVDWPIGYHDLEPYYCRAEWEMGISGRQNPDDPPRSRPFPMEAFPHGYYEKLWFPVAERLGVRLASVSVARNSRPYNGRSRCVAYSVCRVCPSGAKYSSDTHVFAALQTGNCDLFANTVARRVERNASGHVSCIYASDLSHKEHEIRAKRYVVACHGVESARLLLLSNVGNDSGHVGRYLMEHLYVGLGGFQSERVYPERIGFSTLECNSFYDGPDRENRNAIKIEFGPNHHDTLGPGLRMGKWGKELAKYDEEMFGRWISVKAETEQLPNPNSRVTLDLGRKDQFGDPVPHIHFELSERDCATHAYALDMVARFLKERGVKHPKLVENKVPAAHHMGTCRMSERPEDGVVDRNCRVHGTDNLYAVGSSVFPTAGARQPTLTIAALALRLADRLLSET